MIHLHQLSGQTLGGVAGEVALDSGAGLDTPTHNYVSVI